MKIYIIGSLRNPAIPEFANFLTNAGYEAFADWYSAGFEADDKWRDYAKARGWSYKQALESFAAENVFQFDKRHLDASDVAVLLAPAGKSAHMELSYFVYNHKRPGFILFEEEPERYDVMLKFSTEVLFNRKELLDRLKIL